jgi:aromatic ring-cleaving dioxygenase
MFSKNVIKQVQCRVQNVALLLKAFGATAIAALNLTVAVTGKRFELIFRLFNNVTKAIGHVPRELVVVNFQDFQISQFLELLRDGTSEFIIEQPKSTETRHVSHLGWDSTSDSGIGQGEGCQRSQKTYFRRNGPSDFVGIEPNGD